MIDILDVKKRLHYRTYQKFCFVDWILRHAQNVYSVGCIWRHVPVRCLFYGVYLTACTSQMFVLWLLLYGMCQIFVPWVVIGGMYQIFYHWLYYTAISNVFTMGGIVQDVTKYLFCGLYLKVCYCVWIALHTQYLHLNIIAAFLCKPHKTLVIIIIIIIIIIMVFVLPQALCWLL